MTRNWKITEKTISILILLWGVFSLILNIWSINLLTQYFTWKEISIFKLFWNYHFQILISLLTIFAGIMLFLNKKEGWLLSLVILAIKFISSITIPFIIDVEAETKTIIFYLLFGLIPLIFLTMLGILLTKQIRNKYNPTKKTWLIMGSLFAILQLYKLLIK